MSLGYCLMSARQNCGAWKLTLDSRFSHVQSQVTYYHFAVPESEASVWFGLVQFCESCRPAWWLATDPDDAESEMPACACLTLIASHVMDG
jgi:hypothetical protein